MMNFTASEKMKRWSYSDIILTGMSSVLLLLLAYLVKLLVTTKNYKFAIAIFSLLILFYILNRTLSGKVLIISYIINFILSLAILSFPIYLFYLILLLSFFPLSFMKKESRRNYMKLSSFIFALLFTLLFYNFYSSKIVDFIFNTTWNHYKSYLEENIDVQLENYRKIAEGSYDFGFQACTQAFLESAEIRNIDSNILKKYYEEGRINLINSINRSVNRNEAVSIAKQELYNLFKTYESEIIISTCIGIFLNIIFLLETIIRNISEVILRFVKF